MKVIDIHGHLVPPSVIHHVENSPNDFPNVGVRGLGENRYLFSFNGKEQAQPMDPSLLDVGKCVDWLDDNRIDLQIEGTWSGIFGYMLPPEEGAAWSRFLNEETIRMVRGSDRLLAVATVPLQDGHLAARELEVAREMGYVGITIGTTAGGKELDDPDLEPLWAAAAEFQMPVFVHPPFPREPRLQAHGLAAVHRVHETSVAVSRLLCAGVPLRHPGLSLVLAHGGGSLPYVVGRLKRRYEVRQDIADPVAGFRGLYFDSAVYMPEILRFLVELAGPDRVMLGSDYPFPIQDPRPRRVAEEAGLPGQTVDAILGGNALRVFGIR